MTWRNLEQVEFATLKWVDWFNNRRLFGPIGNMPPTQFEARYDQIQEAPAMAAGLTYPSLRRNPGRFSPFASARPLQPLGT